MAYTWVRFYTELAERLLPYKNDQAKLISFISEMNSKGIKTISLEETLADGNKTKIDQIDPFTFYANFNRGTTNENRISILSEIQKEFSVQSEVPTDFDGIPVVNNMASWYFTTTLKGKKSDDIDSLWLIAEQCLQGSPETINQHLFSKCLSIKGVGIAKLTMGLFWLNPEKFVSVDEKNIIYLKNKGLIIKEQECRSLKGYRKVVAMVKENFKNVSFPELSNDAWNYATSKAKESNNEINLNSLVKNGNEINRNIILYGPPGTGKTYNTVNKALEIILAPIDKNKSIMLKVNNKSDNYKVTELGKILSKDNNSFLERDIIRAAYQYFRDSKQIEFVTFHQSFSYEDFIEGIKPIPAGGEENETDEMIYRPVDGILKRICNRARKIKSETLDQKIDLRESTRRFFKMSLGGKYRGNIHEWCLSNNYLALGYGADKDLTELKSIDDWITYRDTFSSRFPDLVEKTRFHIQACYIFQHMKVGDIVFITKGNLIIDAIGVIEGGYEFIDKPEIAFYHLRKVRWLAKDLNASTDNFLSKNISMQTIYELTHSDLKLDYLENILSGKQEEELKNYVLIIDEINRGNIANIFGELITLIEPDKRDGMPEQLQAELPYSKESFSVPANLYILGTMNTADRSVEALDTALRRRFSFIEMPPKPELLEDLVAKILYNLYNRHSNIAWDDERWLKIEEDFKNLLYNPAEYDENKKKIDKIKNPKASDETLNWLVEDVIVFFKDNGIDFLDINKLLSIINKRIEKLLDKDHCIGHSYFLDLLKTDYPAIELKMIFQNKILPLLQEYFYGDPAKIGLILGSGFVEIVENSENEKIFADFEHDAIEDLSARKIYKLKDLSGIDATDFIDKLKALI